MRIALGLLLALVGLALLVGAMASENLGTRIVCAVLFAVLAIDTRMRQVLEEVQALRRELPRRNGGAPL